MVHFRTGAAAHTLDRHRRVPTEAKVPMTDSTPPPATADDVLVAPPAPPASAAVFGERAPLADQFAAILADTGVSHGLIGPREVPILWDRHILNCAVAHEAFPVGAEVVDVGSGAGLPGLALAIARPDLHLHLVEPMLRRTTWLSDAVAALELTNCTVHRGRAEEFHGVLSVSVGHGSRGGPHRQAGSVDLSPPRGRRHPGGAQGQQCPGRTGCHERNAAQAGDGQLCGPYLW